MFASGLRRISLVAMVVMALIVTACSSGGSKSAPTPAGTSSQDGGEAKTVYIAIPGPMTGSNADFGKAYVRGAQLAVAEVNESSQLGKIKLDIKTYDDRQDPTEAANIAQRIAQDKSIVAVVGHFSSDSIFAAAPIYNNAPIAMLTPSASHPDLVKNNPAIFRFQAPSELYAIVQAEQIVQKFKWKKIAVMFAQSESPVTQKDAFVRHAGELGAQIVSADVFNVGETDFRPQLTKLKTANPDGLYIAAYQREAALILKQLRDLGLGTKVVGSQFAYGPQLLSLAAKSAEGMVVVTPDIALAETEPDKARPIVREFNKKLKEKFNMVSSNHDYAAYDAVKVVAEAIKRVGTDRKKILSELEQIKGFPGVIGDITFGTRHYTMPTAISVEVKDGKYTLMEGVDFSRWTKD